MTNVALTLQSEADQKAIAALRRKNAVWRRILRDPPAAAAALFLLLGWLGVLLLPAVARRIDPADLVLAFVAAGLFSVGAASLTMERPDPWPRTFGYHEIFHLLALGGQVLLLLVVWRQFP